MPAGDPVAGGMRSDLFHEQEITLRCVTLMKAVVVGLTILFGFGNVWTLALRLGVPPWVAPLQGIRRERLRPARSLLVFSSLMTLALDVADPLIARQMGKTAFDAVGPLLLIGWAEVGPGFLQAISDNGRTSVAAPSREVHRIEQTVPSAEEHETDGVAGCTGAVGCGLWAVGCGLWAVGCGDRGRYRHRVGTISWHVPARKTSGTGRCTSGRFRRRRYGSGFAWARPGRGCWWRQYAPTTRTLRMMVPPRWFAS